MFDSLWVALLTDPRNENTARGDVFSNSPTPRFTVKSEIDDDEEQDRFSVFNTPTCGTGGRRVTLNTQQPENDRASRDARLRDIPPHLARRKGREEARGVPRYEQGSLGQRYQNLLPPPPPGRGGGGPGGGGPGGGGTDSPDDDDDNDRRHRHKHREARSVRTPNRPERFNQPNYTAQTRGLTPGMSGYTGTLLDRYRQRIYEAVSQPGDPAGPEVKSMKISQPKAYKGQDNINIFDEWVNQILRWFRIYKVTGPIRDGDRVMYAGACLEDLAGQWFDQEVESPDRTIRHWTFEDLVCALFV